MKFKHLLTLLVLGLSSYSSQASNSLSYSGRLVNNDGSPVTGPVDLKFELAYTNSSGVGPVLCDQQIADVPLTNGVFHVKLNFTCPSSSITRVLNSTPAGESAAIRVTNENSGKSYPYQALHSLPYSQVSNQLTQMGAVAGQVLSWNGSEWAPANGSATDGTVKSIITGSGLMGGPIVDSGTISIAPGGVVDAHLATGIDPAKLSGTRDSTKYLKGDNSWSSFSDDVLATILTGFSTASSAVVTATDSILEAFGKTQAQLTNKIDKTGGTLSVGTIDGVPTPVLPSQVVNKQYVDDLVGGVGSSQWTTLGSNIYYNTGNVGIGTSAPVYPLVVLKDQNFETISLVQNQTFGTAAAASLNFNVNGNSSYLRSYNAGYTSSGHARSLGMSLFNPAAGGISYVSSDASGAHRFYVAGSSDAYEVVRINSSGNVGIGTTSPGAKLEVNGQVKITGGIPGAGKVLTSDAAGLATWETPASGADNLGNHTATQNIALSGKYLSADGDNEGVFITPLGVVSFETGGSQVFEIGDRIYSQVPFQMNEDGNATTPAIGFANGGGFFSPSVNVIAMTTMNSERMRINSSGNVGIGTTNPGAKLEVAGQVKITGGSPGAGKVLTSDASGLATWETPAAGGISALTGDVTASGSGSVTATIANDAITTGKILNGTILNEDIANSTIAYGKLNLTDEVIPVAKLARLNCNAGEVLTSDLILGYRCVADNSTDSTKVPLAGGTMTGALILSADPTVALGAATKQYVDGLLTSAASSGTNTSVQISNGSGGFASSTWFNFSGGKLGVGPGTTAPTNQLTVVSDGADSPVAKFQNGDSRGAGIEVKATNTGGADFWIQATADNASEGGGKLSFRDRKNADVSRMVIDSVGNVGIKTTSPSSQLHITEADDSWNSSIRMDRSWDSTTDYFQMMYDYEGLKIRTMDNGDDKADIIFKPKDSEALRITEIGNIGIGTNLPGAKLEVAGQIKITGGTPGLGKVLTSNASGLATWESPTATLPEGSISIHYARVATTQNITLSGLQTIDTIALAEGDRVLVKNQTTTSQNGLYVASAGAWTRATDMDSWSELDGHEVIVREGTAFNGFRYSVVANNPGTLGTSAIRFATQGVSRFQDNIALGTFALNSVANSDNVAIGSWSMNQATSAWSNTTIGNYSLQNLTTGYRNAAVGADALLSNQGGYENTAIGVEALENNISGYGNTGIGRGALQQTTGSGNIGLGYYSGSSITTGTNNVVIGANNGSSIATSSNNILISDGTGNIRMRVDGSGNIGMGTIPYVNSSLHVARSATSRVTFGTNGSVGTASTVLELVTKNGLTKGLADSTSKGWEIEGRGDAWSTAANQNDLYFTFWNGLFSSTAMVIDSSAGNVGVGTATPSSKLHVESATPLKLTRDVSGTVYGMETTIDASRLVFNGVGPAPSSNVLVLRHDNGNVGIGTATPGQMLEVVGNIKSSGCLYYASSSLGTCASDERIKKDVHSFDLGLDALLGINPVKFKYNGLGGFENDGHEHLGVIAQEIEKTSPDLIKTQKVQLRKNDQNKTEIKVVDYGAFTYVIINSIKEFYAQWFDDSKVIHRELVNVKAENAELKKENEEIKRRLERLEKSLVKNQQ